jgi:hypothetical protein
VPRGFYGADEPFEPGTRKPERDYLELERLGKKLGIPVPMMHVELDSRDAAGRLVGSYKDRSRTYNRNFWNYIYGLCTMAPAGTATFAAGFLAMKTVGGTVKAWSDDLVAGANTSNCLGFGTQRRRWASPTAGSSWAPGRRPRASSTSPW